MVIYRCRIRLNRNKTYHFAFAMINVLSHTKNPSQNSSLSDAINEALDIERGKYNLVICAMPICDNTSAVPA